MYIDIDLGIRYCYKEEFFRNLVKKFLVEYKEFDLKLLYLNKEDILKLVHKLKGITLNLGAQKLYENCVSLEETQNFENDFKEFMYIFNKSYLELLDI